MLYAIFDHALGMLWVRHLYTGRHPDITIPEDKTGIAIRTKSTDRDAVDI
jgi:hypothetical protein